VTYVYDKVNLLERLREPAGTETAFEYDTNNQRVLTVYPNGSSQRVDYDDSERIKTVRSRRNGTDGPVVHELDYDYRDPLCPGTAPECDRELIQSVTDTQRERETAYTYDLLGRLTNAKITSTNTDQTLERFEYGYDKNSNRTFQVHDGQRSDYTYNPNNEIATSDAGGQDGQTTYDHDPAGNMTSSSAGFEGDYNVQGQTTRMRGPDSLGGALGAEREATFAYAGPGQTQRTQKDSTLFTDDLFGLASETTGQDARSYTRDNQGRLISLRTPQGSHYYLTDNIGSVVALTGPGPDADVTATYRYEPFGETQDITGDLSQPYRFAGEYRDTETGHYKIGLRYYNPQLARWTQQDSLTGYTDPRRANPYIYAGQDPINQTDPTGAIFGVDAGDAFDAVGDAFKSVAPDDPSSYIARGLDAVAVGCGATAVFVPVTAPVTGPCAVTAAGVGAVYGGIDAVDEYNDNAFGENGY
jgi:RHS repeat-associated protein